MYEQVHGKSVSSKGRLDAAKQGFDASKAGKAVAGAKGGKSADAFMYEQNRGEYPYDDLYHGKYPQPTPLQYLEMSLLVGCLLAVFLLVAVLDFVCGTVWGSTRRSVIDDSRSSKVADASRMMKYGQMLEQNEEDSV